MKLLDIAKKLTKDDQVSLAMLDHIEATLSKIEKANGEIAKAKIRHQKELGELKLSLEKIQNTCGHEVTKYHGDPSGGSDSYTVCEICGKEIGKSNVRFT